MAKVEVTVSEPSAPSPNSRSTSCETASVGEITGFLKRQQAKTEYDSILSFEEVLFPIDFSSGCVQTAAYVAGFAAKFDSHVTLLHAVDGYDPFGYGAASKTQL